MVAIQGRMQVSLGISTRALRCAVVIGLALSSAWLPGVAGADSICQFIAPQLTVIVGHGEQAVVTRSGDDVLLDGAFCGTGAVSGDVTVTGVGDIYFYDNGDNHEGQSASILLEGGAFAPGLDTGASAEIDFSYYASGVVCDPVQIVGTADADHITWGTTSGTQMGNLNADEAEDVDADIWTAHGCIYARVAGGDGNDVVSGAGGADTGKPDRFLLWFSGGAGADLLTGGNSKDTILGGPGRDRIAGGRYNDQRLSGGEGNDHLEGNDGGDLALGGAGRDILLGGPGDDRLKGGSGFDICKGGPGADRFAGCEKVVE